MKILLSVPLLLFAVACCLPALEFNQTQNPKDILSGINVLAVGWSGIFAGIIAWYANPVWLFSLIMGFAGKTRVAAIFGIIALAIGCTTFSLFGRELPADEGGVTQMTLVRTLTGCYAWLASLATLPLIALFSRGK
jgi:hypothetical protein